MHLNNIFVCVFLLHFSWILCVIFVWNYFSFVCFHFSLLVLTEMIYELQTFEFIISILKVVNDSIFEYNGMRMIAVDASVVKTQKIFSFSLKWTSSLYIDLRHYVSDLFATQHNNRSVALERTMYAPAYS